MSERYLITGANGQLGAALQAAYPAATALSREQLDISDMDQVNSIDWDKFDVIINAAAYVNADNSETPEGRKKTWLANAIGPNNLARIAKKKNLQLIHFSSEYVFDGITNNHIESEPFTPLSVYGQTKAAADIAVGTVSKHHILRISWVVGDGHNFVRTMAKLADLRINPKVVDDQLGRLTFTDEVVRAVDHILVTGVPSGTYNLSNDGEIVSWADLPKYVFQKTGHDPERVAPISTVEYASEKQPFAPRPTNSDMDLTKIRATGFKSQDYQPALDTYLAAIVKNRPAVESTAQTT